MDRWLRLRDRQHPSRGNPSPVVQLGVSKLARDAANGGGRPLWRRRGARDQRRLAHCMPIFDSVACAGSARSSDHRYGALRSTHRALFGKSQIARRRQTFLSAWFSLRWALPAAQRRQHLWTGPHSLTFQPLPFDTRSRSDQQSDHLALAAVISGRWVAPAMNRPA